LHMGQFTTTILTSTGAVVSDIQHFTLQTPPVIVKTGCPNDRSGLSVGTGLV
jgi:hypothetical protein